MTTIPHRFVLSACLVATGIISGCHATDKAAPGCGCGQAQPVVFRQVQKLPQPASPSCTQPVAKAPAVAQQPKVPTPVCRPSVTAMTPKVVARPCQCGKPAGSPCQTCRPRIVCRQPCRTCVKCRPANCGCAKCVRVHSGAAAAHHHGNKTQAAVPHHLTCPTCGAAMKQQSPAAGNPTTEQLPQPPEAEAAPAPPTDELPRGPVFQQDARHHPVSEGEVGYLRRISQGFRQLLAHEKAGHGREAIATDESSHSKKSLPLPLASADAGQNPVQLGVPQDESGVYITTRGIPQQQRQASPSEFAVPVMSVDPSGDSSIARIEDWPHHIDSNNPPVSNIADAEPAPAELNGLLAPGLTPELAIPERTASQPTTIRQRY